MAFIDKTSEMAADVHKVYDAWTAFEAYSTFMETIETVTVTQSDRSTGSLWSRKTPMSGTPTSSNT
jgi:uncharacterized membrane protein